MKPAVIAAVGGASAVGALVLLSGLLSGRRSPRVALSDSAADEEAIGRMLVLSRGRHGYIAKYRWLPVEDVVLILAVRHQREAGYLEEQ